MIFKMFQVRPHIPQLDSIQLTLNTNPDTSPSCSGSLDSLDTDTLTIEAMEESLNYTADLKSSNIKGIKLSIGICTLGAGAERQPAVLHLTGSIPS